MRWLHTSQPVSSLSFFKKKTETQWVLTFFITGRRFHSKFLSRRCAIRPYTTSIEIQIEYWANRYTLLTPQPDTFLFPPPLSLSLLLPKRLSLHTQGQRLDLPYTPFPSRQPETHIPDFPLMSYFKTKNGPFPLSLTLKIILFMSFISCMYLQNSKPKKTICLVTTTAEFTNTWTLLPSLIYFNLQSLGVLSLFEPMILKIFQVFPGTITPITHVFFFFFFWKVFEITCQRRLNCLTSKNNIYPGGVQS